VSAAAKLKDAFDATARKFDNGSAGGRCHDWCVATAVVATIAQMAGAARYDRTEQAIIRQLPGIR
jgi:hypothetical protein